MAKRLPIVYIRRITQLYRIGKRPFRAVTHRYPFIPIGQAKEQVVCPVFFYDIGCIQRFFISGQGCIRSMNRKGNPMVRPVLKIMHRRGKHPVFCITVILPAKYILGPIHIHTVPKNMRFSVGDITIQRQIRVHVSASLVCFFCVARQMPRAVAAIIVNSRLFIVSRRLSS